MDGVHATVVSEPAGHSKIETTLPIYAAYIRNMQATLPCGWTLG